MGQWCLWHPGTLNGQCLESFFNIGWFVGLIWSIFIMIHLLRILLYVLDLATVTIIVCFCIVHVISRFGMHKYIVFDVQVIGPHSNKKILNDWLGFSSLSMFHWFDKHFLFFRGVVNCSLSGYRFIPVFIPTWNSSELECRNTQNVVHVYVYTWVVMPIYLENQNSLRNQGRSVSKFMSV